MPLTLFIFLLQLYVIFSFLSSPLFYSLCGGGGAQGGRQEGVSLTENAMRSLPQAARAKAVWAAARKEVTCHGKKKKEKQIPNPFIHLHKTTSPMIWAPNLQCLTFLATAGVGDSWRAGVGTERAGVAGGSSARAAPALPLRSQQRATADWSHLLGRIKRSELALLFGCFLFLGVIDKAAC